MFVDIHCHLLPGIDDGATDLATSIEMARIAVADGITTAIVTPHQLDRYRKNSADTIRQATRELQSKLVNCDIQLQLLPGGDVRIEPELVERIKDDSIMTLADQKRHVLLELPHELYFPIDPLLKQLRASGITGILTHPERNADLMRHPETIEYLVQEGCLMQVTAGSITGSFGRECQRLSKTLLKRGLVHFVATDAHGIKRRRPTLRQAFETTKQLVGERAAQMLFTTNPKLAASGEDVKTGTVNTSEKTGGKRWFGQKRTASSV